MAVIEESKCTLTPVEWQAVKVAARAADEAREKLEPGTGQKVDLLLRIQGTVDVGEDGQTSRKSVPSAKSLLAWILSLDLIAEHAKPQILAQLRACAGLAEGTIPEVEEGYHAQAAMAIAAVSPSKPIHRNGAIRGMLRVGVVNTDQLEQQVSGAVEKATRAIMLAEE